MTCDPGKPNNKHMKRLTHFSIFVMGMLILSQCDPSISERTPESGTADFSSYVAVGNSLTAGYSDNALHRDGQLNSFPAIIGAQMHQAGGGDFLQPLVQPGVGSNSSGQARLVLTITIGPDGSPALSPVPAASQGQNIFADNQTGPFNNMGVPGARTYHIVTEGYGNRAAGPGNYNPFFTRFKSDANASVLGDAMMAQPTFFTLWIGNNDIMAYATSGGSGDPDGGMGSNDITPGSVFTQSVQAIVGTLTSGGAKGAVINIPDVTNIPFFTTVPWNGLHLTPEQAAALRQGYEAQGVPESMIPDFQQGANGFVIEDPESPVGFRMAESGEFILLSVPQASLQTEGWGSTTPIPDEYTLREPQVLSVRGTILEFNEVLESVASGAGLAFVDIDAHLSTLIPPSLGVFDGLRLSTEYVLGGVFSLDGVHMTERGAAMVANVVIEEINHHYGSTLSPVNISAYQGVQFP